MLLNNDLKGINYKLVVVKIMQVGGLKRLRNIKKVGLCPPHRYIDMTWLIFFIQTSILRSG